MALPLKPLEKPWGGLQSWAGRAVWPVVYNTRLKGKAFSTLMMEISDPWPGDVTAGRSLIAGALDGGGETIPLTSKDWHGLFVKHGRQWAEKAHSFSFLRDLRAVGGEDARRIGRQLMIGWINQHHLWSKQVWDPALTGIRLSHWLTFYHFFIDSAQASDQNKYFLSLSRQLRHLELCAHKVKRPMAAIACAKGLIISAVVLADGRKRLDIGLSLLSANAAKFIGADGAVKTRNPMHGAEVLGHLVDVRLAMRKAGQKCPEPIDEWITTLAKALRFFRLGDKRLSVVNGSQEGSQPWLDQLAALSGVAVRRIPTYLPDGGYFRAEAAKLCLMFDVGTVGAAYAGALSFELSDRQDRLVVNCGSHPLRPEWNKYLRMTAAHSTVTINDRSCLPCEPFQVQSRVLSEGVLLEASHDGYAPYRHARKLFLHNKGSDLRGEDHIYSQSLNDEDAEIVLRFHLHPDMQVVGQSEGVTLRAKSGRGWRFTASLNGGQEPQVRVEESLYLGQGAQKRKSSHIAVTVRGADAEYQVNWAFCRL